MYQNLLAQSGFSMDRLAALCAIADTGSIVAAARSDASRQSLMSRQIRELETFFGVDLVRRAGRGLALTDAGRELAAIGRQHFNALSDYAAHCRQQPWSARIVASNSTAEWLLLPRLKIVFDSHPEVHLELHHEPTREMTAGTREGRYDVAFLRKDALVPGLQHAVLGRIQNRLFIPKTISPNPPGSAAAALSTLPMALPIGGQLREKIDRLAAAHGGTPQVVLGCSSYLQAARAAQSRICAAILPETATTAFHPDHFHSLPIPSTFTLCLAWTKRNIDTRPALEALLLTLQSTMKLSRHFPIPHP